jgi:hypothetical protein
MNKVQQINYWIESQTLFKILNWFGSLSILVYQLWISKRINSIINHSSSNRYFITIPNKFLTLFFKITIPISYKWSSLFSIRHLHLKEMHFATIGDIQNHQEQSTFSLHLTKNLVAVIKKKVNERGELFCIRY